MMTMMIKRDADIALGHWDNAGAEAGDTIVSPTVIKTLMMMMI